MKESTKKAIKKYEENVKQLNLRVDKEILNAFNDYCKQVGATKKDVFEAAIMEYIDRH